MSNHPQKPGGDELSGRLEIAGNELAIVFTLFIRAYSQRQEMFIMLGDCSSDTARVTILAEIQKHDEYIRELNYALCGIRPESLEVTV